MRRLICCVLLASLGLLGANLVAGEDVPASSSPEVRGLWVVRDSLTSPLSIDRVVQHAVANGFNTLLVQVRGRGDAYYTSAVEPRAQALEAQPLSFDPFGTMLETAHRAGLKVHAWINTNVVSSAVTLPSAREHVVNRHPDWLMVPRALAQDLSKAIPAGPGYVGRLARWTRSQPQEIEGLFLSPIVPAAAKYTVSVVDDLVQRYPVDGIHLDYVRYPGPQFDYSRLALEEFVADLAPSVPSPERARLTAQAHDDVLAWVDAYPDRWSQFRRSRLTALVMQIRTAARARRPNIQISAAVFPDARDAFEHRLQDWRQWADGGLVDILCPMAYTPEIGVFRRQVTEAVQAAGPAQVWAGIGAYRLTPAQAVAHIGVARSSGTQGIVLFSYDTIAARPSDGYLETVRRDAFDLSAAGSR